MYLCVLTFLLLVPSHHSNGISIFLFSSKTEITYCQKEKIHHNRHPNKITCDHPRIFPDKRVCVYGNRRNKKENSPNTFLSKLSIWKALSLFLGNTLITFTTIVNVWGYRKCERKTNLSLTFWVGYKVLLRIDLQSSYMCRIRCSSCSYT